MDPLTEERKEELTKMLDDMSRVSSAFYAGAVRIGNHPFIEFCGLMNEYIQICGDNLKKGIDYTVCNAHSGESLEVLSHRRDYFMEKLDCIFSDNFKDLFLSSSSVKK